MLFRSLRYSSCYLHTGLLRCLIVMFVARESREMMCARVLWKSAVRLLEQLAMYAERFWLRSRKSYGRDGETHQPEHVKEYVCTRNVALETQAYCINSATVVGFKYSDLKKDTPFKLLRLAAWRF